MAFALALAKAVTCHAPVDGDACDRCVSCLQLEAGEHPDVRRFEPDGVFLKIAQMRDLAREAQYQPFDGRRRVMIVDAAHQMRDEAANAILKTLEEPPQTSLIILVTDQPYALLQTIRSRCQAMWFAPIPAEVIERYLFERFKRPADETRLLSRIADGRIGRALATDLSEYREHRKEMLGLVELLAGDLDRVRLMKAAQYLADVGRKDRAEFDERLRIFVSLCRDVYGIRVGESPDSVANVDIADRLAQVAAVVRPDRVAGWYESISTLREQLRQNVNRQLALESILLSQGQGIAPSP
jgi:DNA polymerase-3 subunit delta'